MASCRTRHARASQGDKHRKVGNATGATYFSPRCWAAQFRQVLLRTVGQKTVRLAVLRHFTTGVFWRTDIADGAGSALAALREITKPRETVAFPGRALRRCAYGVGPLDVASYPRSGCYVSKPWLMERNTPPGCPWPR